MSYALVILEAHGARADRGLEGGQAAYAAMLAFAQQLKERGQLVMTQALSTEQTRVRRSAQGVEVLDGPFTEAKELVGGIFVLQNVDRDQALRIAAECPAAAWATVELRALGPCFT
ncbi:hypothetical protein HNQ51_000250 [Inhella inkyongensis]|uniref:YCII-related domain-containing protein n=1 Tax=Inhella inkyongensis TaxID=392593 RepID=A0A840RW99_9BURK|nr:YciI family protein [Inhella inkyongensis]MBB5202957.1 hypothetical protein [Inhella inkyongensis]